MKKRDYLKKRSELTTEYQQKIEALELVWRMFNADDPLPVDDSDRESDDESRSWPFEISKRDVVRQAIASVNGDFGAKDVRIALNHLNAAWSEALDDNQLSSLVARLADKNEVGVIRQKSGRAPAIYTTLTPARRIAEGGQE